MKITNYKIQITNKSQITMTKITKTNKKRVTAVIMGHDVKKQRTMVVPHMKSFCGGPGGSFFKKSPLAAGGKK
jgi:hypothetical protein